MVRVQVPRSVVKIVPSARFSDAYEVEIESRDVPPAFRAFCDEIRASAQRSLPVESKTPYDPWRRLTVFDDALLFDTHGSIVKNIVPGHHEVSLLVQLDGAWTSEMSWGLRFRVTQIKVHAEHVKPYEEPAVRILVNGHAPLRPPASFLFVDDD